MLFKRKMKVLLCCLYYFFLPNGGSKLKLKSYREIGKIRANKDKKYYTTFLKNGKISDETPKLQKY